MDGKTYCRGCYVEEAFRAAFSRAVKSLLKRGLIESLWLVPLAECEEGLDIGFGSERVMRLADGLYCQGSDRQVRFVKC